MPVTVIDFPKPELLVEKYRVVCHNPRCQALLEYTQDESNFDECSEINYIICPKCKQKVNTRYSTQVDELGFVYDESTKRVAVHRRKVVVYAYKNGSFVEFFGVDGLPLTDTQALDKVRVPNHEKNEVYNRCAKLLGFQSQLRSK